MNKNIDTIVKKLRTIPFCEGIIYSGSRFDGDHLKSSDYDFVVLIKKGTSYFRIFRYKNFLIDISCSTAQVLSKEDIVREKIGNSELHILAHGEILFDTANKMKKLQQKAKRIWKLGPKKYTKNDLKEAGYLCFNSLHKLSKQNAELSHSSWNQIMAKITKLFFEIHSEWMPKDSLREKKIKEIDKKFYSLYEKAYTSSSKERIKNTKMLIKHLVKKFKLPQTGESYSPR